MSILDRHRELFAKFATPGNALTRDGLSAIMQSVGSEVVPLNWLTDEDINGAMNAYDLNHDGLISQEEFEQMAKDNVFLLRSLNEYRQIFDSLDTGKNNLIGPTEMYRYFEDQKCGRWVCAASLLADGGKGGAGDLTLLFAHSLIRQGGEL